MNTERPANDQQGKPFAAVKAGQRISWEETQHLVMSQGSWFQAVKVLNAALKYKIMGACTINLEPLKKQFLQK